MQYIILFSILTVFIIFHFVFYFKIKDGTNQFLIFGVYAFYGLCTIIKEFPLVTMFLENIGLGFSDIVYYMSMILDIYCVVIFLMHLIDSRIFRSVVGIAMTLELIIFMITVFLWNRNIQSYQNFFMIGILCVGSISLIYSIVFFIYKWETLSTYYRTIIIATFVMICWFLGLLSLTLTQFQYNAFCGIGILSYFIVYAIASWNEIVRRYTPHKNIDIEKVNITANEKTVLDVMLRYNVTATREIAKFTYFSSYSSIDACVYRLMSKYQVSNRADLITIAQNNMQSE